jgi:hypothetical protein
MHTSSSAPHGAARGAHGMLSHVASWAALAALVGASWQTCRATHQRRMAHKPRAKPEREQIWEDEGGQNQMPKSPPP